MSVADNMLTLMDVRENESMKSLIHDCWTILATSGWTDTLILAPQFFIFHDFGFLLIVINLLLLSSFVTFVFLSHINCLGCDC